MNPEIAESPARNRVTPLGDIVAIPLRGTAQVITPPSTVASLRAGDPVQIDGGARK